MNNKKQHRLYRFAEWLDRIMPALFVLYALLAVWGTTVMSELYQWTGTLAQLGRYVCYLLFFCKVVLDILRSKKVSMIMVAAGVLALLVIVFSKQFVLGFFVLIFAAMGTVDKDKTMRYALVAVSVLFLAVITASAFGLLPDWIYYRDTTVRHSLGFIYPTDLFSVFLLIVLLYFYCNKAKVQYRTLALFQAINVLLYFVTDGRLSFTLITTTLLIMLASKLCHSNEKIRAFKDKVFTLKTVKICCMCLPILMLIFSIATVLLYRADTTLGNSLNNLLSDRLLYGSDAIENYPLTPFGTFVEWKGWGGYGYVEGSVENFVYNFVDCWYIRALFDYGIVGTLAILAAYTWLLGKCFDKKNWVLLFVVVIILVWSFVEPYLLNIGRNVFVLFLAPSLQYGKIEFKFLHKLSNKLLGEENETV